MPVDATINGNQLRGNVIAVVPRGDVATRTFPVKIRTANRYSLIEGMSARVILPTADSVQALIVPRDAVISKFGQEVVYVASDSRARMIPVTVIGYTGLNAGVESADLKAGMLIVLEGNERLRDKQVIEVVSRNAEVGKKE
jgi:multidrug efflux pump subunit AcrA (membrane-fusion protein)